MSDAPDDVVGYEVRASAAWLTIERPESRNALTPGVIAGLHAGIARAENDAAVHAIVLTGAGDRSFCAGADLKLMARAPQSGGADSQTGVADSQAGVTHPPATYADVLRALNGCALPTVARVNGHCMAGGMGLLAACDLAVATESAQFGLPEVKVGLFAMQVLSVIRALVGTRTLREMTLTGEPLDAHAARAAGLLNYVVSGDELDAKVEWLLSRLVDKSPTAQRRGKRAMREIEGKTAFDALPYLEEQLGALLITEDAREGARAFVERRSPQWTGR